MVKQAEFTVEDTVLVSRIEPIILEQTGFSRPDFPRMLQTAVLQMLEIDDAQPLTDAEQAFVEELSAGVAAFWENREPLVITVNPVDYIYSNDIFLAGEGDRLSFIRPGISNVPSDPRSIVLPVGIAAALADSASLDDVARMKNEVVGFD